MKAYILEVLVIDFDKVGKDIPDVIEDQKYPNRCISPKVIGMKEADIGEWDDDHPLNQRDKSPDLVRSYFTGNPSN